MVNANHNAVVLVADDDSGHSYLIESNLRDNGLKNEIVFLRDGREVLDFLMCEGAGPHRRPDVPYVLLLDLHMPRVDGIEILSWVRRMPELKKLPIFVLTTTDDPREIDLCYRLGCNLYLTKPVNFERFCETMRQIALLIRTMSIPSLNGLAARTPEAAAVASHI